MSSLASLIAVNAKTKTSGMMVVTGARELICGMSYNGTRTMKDAEVSDRTGSYLKEEKEEKVGVGQTTKLFEEILGQECDQAVFACGDLISLKRVQHRGFCTFDPFEYVRQILWRHCS